MKSETAIIAMFVIGILIGFWLSGAFSNDTTSQNNPSIQKDPTPKINSVGEINRNPVLFENKSVTVYGLFYEIIGYGIYDTVDYLGKNPKTKIDYKLIDSQGFELFISAPNRELNIYNGQALIVDGVIRRGYKCFMKECEPSYYLELSKVSQYNPAK